MRRTMARNSPLVTMMPVIYSGILFDLQPKPQGQGQMPLKKGLPIEKYGGYNKVTGACFMLVEHTCVDVGYAPSLTYRCTCTPTLSPTRSLRYATASRCADLKEPRIILPIIRMRALLSLDGYKMYITGRTNGNLCIQNANQLMVSEEWEQYIKKIVKAAAGKYGIRNVFAAGRDIGPTPGMVSARRKTWHFTTCSCKKWSACPIVRE